MSFIKVTDPRKREELIKDFIETRKRIKDNFVARKVGESEYQTGLTKLFKPVTETQKATAKEITEAQKATAEKITSELLPIKEGLENLTVIPAIEAGEEKEEKKDIPLLESLTEEEKISLGPIAQTFLSTPWKKENLDLLFGLNTLNPEEKYKIGDKFVKFDGDDIKVNGDTYKGTPGFWSLIVSKNPPPDSYTKEDKEQYKRLLIDSNAIFKNNDPNETNPKGNYRGDKWKGLINSIWQEIKPKPKGKGGKGEERNDKKTPNLLQVAAV